jgi:FKBP-type peptidyl-prolyl cis-trans isomerase SlyD
MIGYLGNVALVSANLAYDPCSAGIQAFPASCRARHGCERVHNMLIEKEKICEVCQDKVVRLGFSVKDRSTGGLIQYGDDLVYLHGGYGGAFPKVELAMEGRRVGDHVTLELSPDEGYGLRRSELVLTLPSDEFADEMPETGEAVDGQLPDGRSMTFTVSAVADGQITLDGNHPFAGKHLVFAFEVLEIRASTEAERSAGFAFDAMFC